MILSQTDRVGQLGAHSFFAVQNQGASARGRLIKRYSSVVISIGATDSVHYREVVPLPYVL